MGTIPSGEKQWHEDDGEQTDNPTGDGWAEE